MFKDNSTILRPACRDDIAMLGELEKRIWGGFGMPAISEARLHTWLDINAPGFIVALRCDTPCGYVYTENIYFDPTRMDTADFQEFVRTGYLTDHHVPDGNTLHGVSIATDRPGVGVLLLREVTRLAIEGHKKHLVAFARMPGLSRFWEATRNVFSIDTVDDETLARWYAIQCVELVRGKQAPELARFDLPCELPNVTRKDPVLSLFTAVLGTTLYEIVPTPMPDRSSMDRAALLVRSYKNGAS